MTHIAKDSKYGNDEPASPRSETVFGGDHDDLGDFPSKTPTKATADETPNILTLTGEDPPVPGCTYIISQSDSRSVITNNAGVVTLAELEAYPEPTQKWVCHISDGWLGFVNDSNGSNTVHLGHNKGGTLICTATRLFWWEQFCVRKREGRGFEILVRHWNGLVPLGLGADSKSLTKTQAKATWWSFTKLV